MNLNTSGMKMVMWSVHIAAIAAGIAGGLWFFDTFTQ